MPKKAPKVKKKLEDFDPLMQKLLKLQSDGTKTEWTESSSDSSKAPLNSSEDNKLLDKLFEFSDGDKSDNTKILEDILKTLNKLQKESIKAYHTIISNSPPDPELKREYFRVSENIKKINTFLLTEVLNKEYHIYDIKKGSKKFKLISGKYEEKPPRELEKNKKAYSFF
jgi:hypothetical protein